jgi:two-component system chemotaxis sensor kinase CheA
VKSPKSLRHKFVRTMLLVAGMIGGASLAIVVMTSVQTSNQHLSAIRTHIHEGISGKGKVLTRSHALALRGLSLDNAFQDMRRLVEQAVNEDDDVVYGIFVNATGAAVAFSDRGDATKPGAAPDREAWKKLGLSKDDVLSAKETVRQANVLGQDVVEVAAPVVAEDGEPLGTVRYGLSTRRMQHALASAKAESEASLRSSILLIGSLLTLTTLLGILLSRVQAFRITRPVGDLTDAAKKLAAGKRDVRVSVESGDELELLGTSFNKMVEDLNASYENLEQMNHTLELKVEARTSELARRNRDMRLVFDNVDQGFVALSAEGTMPREHSQILHRWFGECTDGASFWQYLGNTSASFGLAFELAWQQIAEDILPLELSIDQLPKQLATPDKVVSLRYLPYSREGKLDGVLVVMSDITERLHREREEAEQRELMHAFKRVMSDRTGFVNFQRDAAAMVESICGDFADRDEPAHKRMLHTLKGNSAVMGLGVIAGICHALEEELAAEGATSARTVDQLRGRWQTITDHIGSFVDNGAHSVIEVPEAEYMALVARVSDDPRHIDIADQLLAWQLEPITRPLGRLAEQAKELARRLGRGDIDVVLEGNDVRLDPHVWSPFFSELVHVVRNAVDHGIESPQEREALRKKRTGTITFKARAVGKSVEFEIGDDGRGIHWEVIAERAREKGLPAATSADLLTALCSDGFTTKDQATEISGRGIGLSAVKQRVEAMNGRIEVRSKAGAGTTWIFSFPSLDARVDRSVRLSTPARYPSASP